MKPKTALLTTKKFITERFRETRRQKRKIMFGRATFLASPSLFFFFIILIAIINLSMIKFY